MIHLLCFGNPYLKEDNLALRIADQLIQENHPRLQVTKCVSPDEILHFMDKEFFILDVVRGLSKTTIIDDIDKLKENNLVTLHDFDLGFFLKLMKETGKINNVNIIGIPQIAELEPTKKEVVNILKLNQLPTQDPESE